MINTAAFKKVIITGGLGFIGKNLTGYLLEHTNAGITIIDNNSIHTLDSFREYFKSDRITYVADDLSNPKHLHECLAGADIVFHLCANSDISKGVENPEIDFLNTTTATYNILNAMKNSGVNKIVFSSGSGIYGVSETNYFNELHAPLFPVSHYGASKLCAEALISAFVHMHQMQAWIFRFANVVGDWQSHGVVYDFIKRLKISPDSLTVLGNGYQNKSYIHVKDVLNAIFTVLNTKRDAAISAFNVSNDDTITVRDIVKIILEEMELPDTEVIYGTTAYGWIGDVPEIKLKNEKVISTGWKFNYSSPEAIRAAVKFLMNEK